MLTDEQFDAEAEKEWEEIVGGAFIGSAQAYRLRVQGFWRRYGRRIEAMVRKAVEAEKMNDHLS